MNRKIVLQRFLQTIKEADGIILATTVEWLGIGGYMQQFLDACWLYGDKEKISQTYMQPVVMSTAYGEREGELTLANAWEMLGGLPCAGLCGYVADLLTFEMNQDYSVIIEKKLKICIARFHKNEEFTEQQSGGNKDCASYTGFGINPARKRTVI